VIAQGTIQQKWNPGGTVSRHFRIVSADGSA